MTHFARDERQALADLFDRVGPDAPTLCEGWSARDLAAHLVVRERRPDAAPGILLRPLAGHTAKVQRSVRDGRQWPDLVQAVRSGPPALLRPFDEQANLIEYFVHHEDVRRAAPGWEPRTIEAAMQQALWRRLRPMAKLARRKVPVALTFDAPGFGRLDVRTGEPQVTVSGPPSELVLFAFGRQEAARVDESGDADARQRLRQASLGF